jgi:hypothetical protein
MGARSGDRGMEVWKDCHAYSDVRLMDYDRFRAVGLQKGYSPSSLLIEGTEMLCCTR